VILREFAGEFAAGYTTGHMPPSTLTAVPVT
jgi:hypothetical protein